MEDTQLNKLLNYLLSISIFLFLLHLYVTCFGMFKAYGFTNIYFTNYLIKIATKTHFFDSLWPCKLMCILFLMISCFGSKGKKDEKLTFNKVSIYVIIGLVLFFLNWWIIQPTYINYISYMITCSIGYLFLITGFKYLSRILKTDLMKDVFNTENESFDQETEYIANDRSVNLPTVFYYGGKKRKGWINVINPYRASMIIGTPGSGKSFAILNQYIKQLIEKGFSMYIYDFKMPELTTLAYNHYRLYNDGYDIKPKFYMINFDNPRKSHRCNPLNPDQMYDIIDAYESSYTILLNLNRTWVKKQGDFFVESPINLLTSVIWFLKIYDGGKYCTFPHAIEFICTKKEYILPILACYEDLENYIAPFMDALSSGAVDQLQGQIASATIPLSRIISSELYWVLSGNDFTLDMNNPKDPKIICVGNNPERANIYSAALGLYNARIVKLINKKGQRRSAVIVDELSTIYFKGLDVLIATARSNEVAVALGFQDLSQLRRDYGMEEAKVIESTVGNIFSGSVVGDTAKFIQERCGKILQKRQSTSISKNDTSTSYSTQMDYLVPAGKISQLSQGQFAGVVSDDFGQKLKQKVFNSEIQVDMDKLKADTSKYVPLPDVTNFGTDKEKDKTLKENYKQIKKDVKTIILTELIRISENPIQAHLLNVIEDFDVENIRQELNNL